jgi:hypothetical protein
MKTGRQELLALGVNSNVSWSDWEKAALEQLNGRNEAEVQAALDGAAKLSASPPVPPPMPAKPNPAPLTKEEMDRRYAKELLRYSIRQSPFPAPMSEDAYYGVAGSVVDIADKTTEASREAMLVQFLIAAGNRIGRSAVLKHSGYNFCNDYCVLVGETSTGRKGTAWGVVYHVFDTFVPEWCKRIYSGIQSGEGVIHATRDEFVTHKNGKACVHSGEDDKRILIIEEEFVRLMTVMARKDSTLQPILVEMWDSRKWLRTTSKASSEKSTGVHGSLIGHITPTVLQSMINKSQIQGGFANRLLWVAVEGKPDPVYEPIWIN